MNGSRPETGHIFIVTTFNDAKKKAAEAAFFDMA
jgi:hypothetical protein